MRTNLEEFEDIKGLKHVPIMEHENSSWDKKSVMTNLLASDTSVWHPPENSF
jgi:desulfoferrodoxin (superoxide reductase-like protein)